MPDDLDIPRPGEASLSIVPNVNVSARELPDRVSAAMLGKDVVLDAHQSVKFPGDRQLLPVSITRKQLDITGGEVVTLSVAGFPHRLYDKLGRLVPPTFTKDGEWLSAYVFEMKTLAALNLFLEVVHPVGVPKATGSFLKLSLFVAHPIFSPDIALDADATRLAIDRKDVLVAPVHFISNLQPVEKLFICEVDENAPTVKELEEALTLAGAAHVLQKIPREVSEGDTWLQDQFEAGFCEDHRGNRIHMVVHLPRLRSETADRNAPNLATFVDRYFPSRGIGVCRDFWQREFSVTLRNPAAPGSPTRVSVPFRDTYAIDLAFTLVERLWRGAMSLFVFVDEKAKDIEEPEDIFEKVRNSTALMLTLARAYGSSKKQSDALQRRLEFLAELHGVVRELFPELYTDGARATIRRSNGSIVIDGQLTTAEIRRVYSELRALNDSVNYGGNIEVCPPEEGQRSGRVVIGSSDARKLDPALVSFFETQGGPMPLAIDTSWLEVGHVDELIAFVPTPKSSARWGVLQNSSELGLRILLEAARFHFQDKTLSIDETDWSSINGSSANLGVAGDDRFVSQLLRGRYWQYFFDRKFGPVPQLMPPLMCLAGLVNPPSPDTRADVYPAHMSVLNVLRYEQRFRMNRNLAEGQLAELTTLLGDELEANVFMLPALYDIPEDGLHETFVPNMINMQVVGNHLMIPRPGGPRMAVNDAIAVLKNVMTPDTRADLTPTFVRRLGLENQVMNIRGFPETDYYKEILLSYVTDVFPDTPADFGEKLLRANRTAFKPDETLKAGWQRLTIPEKTVDLFELYTAALLTKLGLTVHFIDTWYYHERHGGLHCGTNTIRKIPGV